MQCSAFVVLFECADDYEVDWTDDRCYDLRPRNANNPQVGKQ